MEGKGLPMEQTYNSVERLFVKTNLFLTMNTLPGLLKEEGPKYKTED